ncbi:MAG: mitofilin family membrane protein [Alphaproteobacteria bacterium]
MTDNSDTFDQDDPFPDAASIIDAFGGVRPMASTLGVAATTIQGWKSRGSVPPPRRQEVRDAAAAAGIDLDNLPESTGAAAPTETEAVSQAAAAEPGEQSVAADSPPEPAAPQKRGGQAIAWLALIVAAGAGIALATQPKWAPLVYGPSSQAVPEDVFTRLDALEAEPPGPSLGPVTARLDSLEAALNALPTDSGPAPELSAQLDRLSQDLAQGIAKTEQLAARIGESERSIAEVRGDSLAASESMKADIAALKADFAALREEVSTLTGKVTALDAREAAVAGRTTGLALAVVSLERAVLDGAPFAGLLTAIERLADDDPVVASSIAVLAPDAATGIPSAATLIKRFDAVAATLGEPLWAETGTGWVDRMLQKVDSVIAVRRIEDSAGNILPARQAELAVARGDLQAAVDALADATGAAADWVRDAKRHIAAERAVAALRVHAVEMLGKGMAESGAPQ